MKKKLVLICFCFCFCFFLISSAQNQVILKNSFYLPNGITNPVLSLFDEMNNVVYFINIGMDLNLNPKSEIYKFNSTNLEFLESTNLGNRITTGIIDELHQMIYFGAVQHQDESNFPQIIQFDLLSFSINNCLNFTSFPNLEFVDSQVDVFHSKGYFILSCFFLHYPHIFKIDLQNFEFDSNATIYSYSNILGSAIDILNQNIYIFSHNKEVVSTMEIQKFHLTNLSKTGTLFLDEHAIMLESIYADIDSSRNLMYAAMVSTASSFLIVKVNLDDFSVDDHLILQSTNYWGFSGGGIDELNQLGYFMIYGNCSIYQIDLSTFRYIQEFSFSNGFSAVSFDSQTTHAYIGFYNSTTIDFDLLKFEVDQSRFVQNFQDPSVILIDEPKEMSYIGFGSGFGLVARIDISSFQLISHLTTGNSSDQINFGEIDSSGGFAYFFINCTTSSQSIPKIMKVELSTFSISENKMIDSNGSIEATSFDIQNHFLYVGYLNFSDQNGAILKINSSDLEIYGYFFISDLRQFQKLFLDSSTKILYSFLYVNNSIGFWLDLIKIDLESFSQISHLDLTNYYPINGTVFDSIHQYIFFQSPYQRIKTKICRIHLIEMEVFDDCLLVDQDEWNFQHSFLDSTQTYAFFLLNHPSNMHSSYLIQITANPFQILNQTHWDYPFNISALDFSKNYLYSTNLVDFGGNAKEMVLFYQISLPNPTPIPNTSNQKSSKSIIIILSTIIPILIIISLIVIFLILKKKIKKKKKIIERKESKKYQKIKKSSKCSLFFKPILKWIGKPNFLDFVGDDVIWRSLTVILLSTFFIFTFGVAIRYLLESTKINEDKIGINLNFFKFPNETELYYFQTFSTELRVSKKYKSDGVKNCKVNVSAYSLDSSRKLWRK
ncbi:t-lymphocyte activation antigen cd86 [Anaeramoeba ignava]|uniref:T-lymphocyte activation antigen cd86 n=1 Tax=Anaeramoeba ignava TaxID=1746090 RepID=A0A9Q0LX75_ANAIG|nr:t-lymphocyte activation antigen cd86 [Anaeramoeba ignava]